MALKVNYYFSSTYFHYDRIRGSMFLQGLTHHHFRNRWLRGLERGAERGGACVLSVVNSHY